MKEKGFQSYFITFDDEARSVIMFSTVSGHVECATLMERNF